MRRIIAPTFALALLTTATACIEPDPQYGQNGCTGASYGTVGGWGSVGNTFGDPYYDQKMTEEFYIQSSFYSGIPAYGYVLYEESPQHKNAYATNDGYILFGYHMFYYTISNYGELAAAGVLAHEFGHRTQYALGWQMQNPDAELEADAFSGYYMAFVKQWAWAQIEGYYANTYAIGDYYFNSPQHHGTPDQRLAAAYLGVNTAIADMQAGGGPRGWNELHAEFSQAITTQILGSGIDAADPVPAYLAEVAAIARGESRGTEVVYPAGRTPVHGGFQR